MNSFSDGLTGALVALFSLEWMALLFAGLMLGGCAVLLTVIHARRVRPLSRAFSARLWSLWELRATPSAAETRRSFFAARKQITEAMERDEPGAEPLRRAWRAWKDTVIDTKDVPWRTSYPAETWFGGIEPDLRVIGLWANLFVAVGLIITFLGVVAALTKATAVIGGGGADPAAMQGALADLLQITATKFWTSIAGLACSIALRLYERRWSSQIERQRNELIERLDDGTQLVHADALTARQLELTVRQTELLQLVADRLGAEPQATARLRAVK